MCNKTYMTTMPAEKESKRCSTCHRVKDIQLFSKNRTQKDGYNSFCRECGSKAGKERYAKIKLTVLEYYGNCKCACCGETRIEFLALDHVKGGGNIDRKKRIKSGERQNAYEYLFKLGLPDKEKYRVLCHNCNMAIGMYGYCPHGNIEPLKRAGHTAGV